MRRGRERKGERDLEVRGGEGKREDKHCQVEMKIYYCPTTQFFAVPIIVAVGWASKITHICMKMSALFVIVAIKRYLLVHVLNCVDVLSNDPLQIEF